MRVNENMNINKNEIENKQTNLKTRKHSQFLGYAYLRCARNFLGSGFLGVIRVGEDEEVRLRKVFADSEYIQKRDRMTREVAALLVKALRSGQLDEASAALRRGLDRVLPESPLVKGRRRGGVEDVFHSFGADAVPEDVSRREAAARGDEVIAAWRPPSRDEVAANRRLRQYQRARPTSGSVRSGVV
jgi:hypothetical protein